MELQKKKTLVRDSLKTDKKQNLEDRIAELEKQLKELQSK
ncbi:hypothetical protein SAMN02745168_0764 [Papillibacter cinnamivorans DSM 12816]|uniref:Uncharacterized protein n=1 Tax=Papillibacter cinnamivorans DSM 12816 TaxID=1122930 RepID=A0A1W1YZ93_9FIRM|nr:hypothetical protein SAMN02745168_0764 [Papillibacter cinnamivorans DSM 12816]